MSKTSWLVATIHEPLNRTYDLPVASRDGHCRGR